MTLPNTNNACVFSPWEYTTFEFTNIFNAAQRLQRGQCVWSRLHEFNGLVWQMYLYPRGSDGSRIDQEFMSVRLHCKSVDTNDTIKAVQVLFSLKVDGDPGIYGPVMSGDIFRLTGQYNPRVGVDNFITLLSLLGPPGMPIGFFPRSPYLTAEGSLVIEVGMRTAVEYDTEALAPWTPPNTLSKDLLSMLDACGSATADIFFQVGDQRQRFHAHAGVLEARAPFLATLAEAGDVTPIPIAGVSPSIFRQLLRFVYGGEIPPKDQLKMNAKALAHVADRFGCTGLKIAAEVELATSGLTANTAADLVLFADAKNCAQLKESAIEFIVSNYDAVKASEGYSRVKESNDILEELMSAMSASINRKKRKAPSDGDGNTASEYKRMCVATLRRKLDEKGLEVDGSKEMLIARLEGAEQAETSGSG